MRTLLLACALTVTVTSATARAQQNDYQKLNDAISSHQTDPAALKQDLAQADALLAREPANPSGHWVRARALEALKQNGDAIVEYRKAAESPAFAGDAHYNIGDILDSDGRVPEAMLEWEQALELDPKNADAAYNLAQQYYLQEKFGQALEKWLLVKSLKSDDFQLARKLVQVYYALGRDTDAVRTRDDVIRIREQSKDPAAAKAVDWVFDQLVLPKGRVFAREPFSPGAVAFTFEVANAKDVTIGRLEFARDGNAYVLRVAGTSPVAVPARAFAQRPAWRDLKPIVRDMALAAFPVIQ